MRQRFTVVSSHLLFSLENCHVWPPKGCRIASWTPLLPSTIAALGKATTTPSPNDASKTGAEFVAGHKG